MAPPLTHDDARPAPASLDTVGEALRSTARTLQGIAAKVGGDASVATTLARQSAEDARRSADLAAELATIAEQVEAAIHAQADLLERARHAARDSEAVVDHLSAAVEGIGAISTRIGEIAARSRLLALNARIEAARSGDAGRGFDVVANEMKHLSQQTWDANGHIADHTDNLTGEVTRIHRLFDDAVGRADEERIVGQGVIDMAGRQGQSARAVADLTQRAVMGIEEATMVIGRVASSAAAVDVIARQLVRTAERIAPGG